MEIPAEYYELDLYEVLEVAKTEPQPAIRKAYLRRALRTHPDKTGGNDDEFRKVSFAYSILSDENRRAQYDESGKLDFREDAAIADLFSKMVRVEITEEMIEEDKRAYQHSEEERKDVYRYYSKYKGDFDLIFENVIHSTEDDMDRLIAIIRDGIRSNELKDFARFRSTTKTAHLKKRKSRAAKEAQEVDESRKAMGIETEAGLAALIQRRQAQRSSFGGIIDRLESKYSVNKTPKSTKKRTKSKNA